MYFLFYRFIGVRHGIYAATDKSLHLFTIAALGVASTTLGDALASKIPVGVRQSYFN